MVVPAHERITPASWIETKRFLTEFTVADQDAARQLWDGHSGAKGLLDARWGNDRGFIYDEERDRYFRLSTARQVSDGEMRLYVRRVSKHAREEMKKETRQFVEGGIIFAVWYSRMRNLMKSLYYTLWLVSVGGFLFDDNTQRALFYAFILNQFGWLDNFVNQINSGTQGLDGWAVVRAGMYGEYGNGGFQNMVLHRRQEQGYLEGRRMLGENENHCHDSDERPGCLELADLGWIPIERIVPIGEATCYSNCHCWIEYRRRYPLAQ